MTKRENKRKIDIEDQKNVARQKWVDRGPRVERGPRIAKEEEPREINENIIEGRNPVLEAFNSKLGFQFDERDGIEVSAGQSSETISAGSAIKKSQKRHFIKKLPVIFFSHAAILVIICPILVGLNFV